jgi:hypothetical protein
MIARSFVVNPNYVGFLFLAHRFETVCVRQSLAAAGRRNGSPTIIILCKQISVTVTERVAVVL